MPVQNTLLNYYNNIEDSHVLVRSEVLYYLKFINYDKDLFNDASTLTSKPTVILYTENAVDKAIFDYSLANETDKKYLKSFFANTSKLDTFTVTGGDFLDVSEISADVGGSFVFTEYKDDKIFATVTSINNENSALSVYDSDYFIGTPQLTKTGSLGSSLLTENYALIGVNTKSNKTLTSMGILPGDLIEVIYNGSQNNQIKYEVLETSVINSKEVVKLKPYLNSVIPIPESLVGYPVLVNVYVKGSQEYSEEDINSDTGCCVSPTNTVKYSNQTRHQCKARFGNYTFIPGVCTSASLSTTTATGEIQEVAIPLIVNTFETAPEVATSNIIFNSSVLTTGFTEANLNLQLVTRDSSYLETNKIVLVDNKKYCFSQTDSSNFGYIIRFSTTSDFYTPYTTGVYGAIRVQGLNSYQFLNTNVFSYPTLYIFLEKTNYTNTGQTVISTAPIKTNYYISR